MNRRVTRGGAPGAGSFAPSGGERQEGAGSENTGPGRDPEAKARQICLRLLTIAPKTRAQLSQAMRRGGVPAETAEAVLDRFTDVGLIDDAAFGRARGGCPAPKTRALPGGGCGGRRGRGRAGGGAPPLPPGVAPASAVGRPRGRPAAVEPGLDP